MKALIVNGTEFEFTDDGTSDQLLATGAIERCNSDGADYTAHSDAGGGGEEDEEDAGDDDEDIYYRLVPNRTFAQKEVEQLIEAF